MSLMLSLKDGVMMESANNDMQKVVSLRPKSLTLDLMQEYQQFFRLLNCYFHNYS